MISKSFLNCYFSHTGVWENSYLSFVSASLWLVSLMDILMGRPWCLRSAPPRCHEANLTEILFRSMRNFSFCNFRIRVFWSVYGEIQGFRGFNNLHIYYGNAAFSLYIHIWNMRMQNTPSLNSLLEDKFSLLSSFSAILAQWFPTCGTVPNYLQIIWFFQGLNI